MNAEFLKLAETALNEVKNENKTFKFPHSLIKNQREYICKLAITNNLLNESFKLVMESFIYHNNT